MLKKMIASVAAVGLAVSLSACSGGDDTSAQQEEVTTQESQAKDTPTQEPEEDVVPVTTIDENTPTGGVDSGIFMGYQVTSAGDCAILNISPDGEVGVVSYFDAMAKHRGANISGPQGSCLRSSSYSENYDYRAAIVGYSLGVGNDNRASIVDADGTYTDLSGHEGSAVEGLVQAHPAFGPDGRLWYWKYMGSLQYELWSVDPAAGAKSARHESEFGDSDILQKNQRFSFVGNTPVSLTKMEDMVADKSGEYVLKGKYNTWEVTSADKLDEGEPYTITGDSTGIDPLTFVGDSADGKPRFLSKMVVNGENSPSLFYCVIDENSKTITTEKIETPTEYETALDASTGALADADGTIYYTNSDEAKNSEGNYVLVTKVIRLHDGVGDIVAVIERSDTSILYPAFLEYR